MVRFYTKNSSRNPSVRRFRQGFEVFRSNESSTLLSENRSVRGAMAEPRSFRMFGIEHRVPSLVDPHGEGLRRVISQSGFRVLQGLQIKQLATGIFINQEKYSKELLNKFGMSNSKSSSTPMSISMEINADEAGKPVDQSLYRKLIGSLLYLTASRPDIQFAVGVCARYQVSPKESHYKMAKRILKYVKGTVDAGLWYPKEGGFNLVGYSDSDLGGCKLDRKSTSGTCHFLGPRLVS
ncbi:hypothetical protein OROMI_018645 [Orobanche minor]